MKRRVLALLVFAALLAVLMALPALAADTVYFTAVNNTLLSLEKSSMPVKYKSMIYVPASLFTSNDLGTYALYSRNAQTVLVSDGADILHFDMSAGSCYDSEGEQYAYVAIYQNDTAYLPAYFVAERFGIEYSYIRSSYGHIIRLTVGDCLSDTDFVEAAASLMESRLAQYRKAEGLTEPTATPRPTSTPRPTPTPRPTATPRPSADPRPPVVQTRDVDVYLAFLGIGEETEGILDALERDDLPACFFATAEQIERYGAAVRRILGQGCTLGILLEGKMAEEWPAASRALEGAAMQMSFLAASDRLPTEEETAWLSEQDLVFWSAGEEQSSLLVCETFLMNAEGRCDLVLTGDFDSVEELLHLLRKDDYTVRPITEVTETRQSYGENH